MLRQSYNKASNKRTNAEDMGSVENAEHPIEEAVVSVMPLSPVAGDVITWKATGKGGAVAAGKINSAAAGIQDRRSGHCIRAPWGLDW